jgi:hypothetical protein
VDEGAWQSETIGRCEVEKVTFGLEHNPTIGSGQKKNKCLRRESRIWHRIVLGDGKRKKPKETEDDRIPL